MGKTERLRTVGFSHLLFMAMAMLGLVTTQPVSYTPGLWDYDIITKTKFSNTDVHHLIDAFVTGANFSIHYSRSPLCWGSVVNLTDKMYEMNLNRTGTVTGKNSEVEGHMLFISGVVAHEYREAFLNCFAMNMQIYADTMIRA